MRTISATVYFSPVSGSAKTKTAALVKNYRAHTSWRSHTHTFKLNRSRGKGKRKELQLSLYDLSQAPKKLTLELPNKTSPNDSQPNFSWSSGTDSVTDVKARKKTIRTSGIRLRVLL